VITALLDSVEHQDSELLVLEGPSAASALRTLRDRRTQAILPMQGKIPNAVKVSWRKLSQHVQIADLLQSLHPERSVEPEFGCFRYQRVVLLNDPDVDGMHAGMLLVLFLFKYLPALIEQGRLYTVQVPLYGLYVRRFKSVASVDREILKGCLSLESVNRRPLTLAQCTRLCIPFEK